MEHERGVGTLLEAVRKQRTDAQANGGARSKPRRRNAKVAVAPVAASDSSQYRLIAHPALPVSSASTARP